MKDTPIARSSDVANDVRIFIAGRFAAAEDACRRFCFEEGLCVTVTPTSYVYTGGAEEGVIVGLINYPRFPSSSLNLYSTALALAEHLMDALCQGSCTVQDRDTATWLNRRG